MVSILIVEDEKKTATMLREMIEIQSEYLVVNTCDSIESTAAWLKKNQSKIDLMFLDIQLADGESFELFQELEVTVPVIFCTAFDEYILKAFKNNGIEYILKPFKEQDIHQALDKFERLKASFSKQAPKRNVMIEEMAAGRSSSTKTFLARIGEKMIPVPADQIAFVMLMNEIIYLFNVKGERFPVFKKMDEMEQALAPEQFYRINRQMIVNRDAIRSIEPYFNRKVVVSLDFKLPEKAIVSRLKVTPFLDWIEKT